MDGCRRPAGLAWRHDVSHQDRPAHAVQRNGMRETPGSTLVSRKPTNLTAISGFTMFSACFNALHHHALPEQRGETRDHRDEARKFDEQGQRSSVRHAVA